MTRRGASPDYGLLALTFLLLAFGTLMMCSASAILADTQMHDPLYFIKRQALWGALGLGAMFFFGRTDYNRLREWVWPALLTCLAALILVLFTRPVAGVKRWIRLGPLGVQPAEFAKLAVLLFLADYVDRKKSKVSSLLHGFLVPWAVVGCILALVGLEPDIGTPALLFSVGLLVLFVGGTRFAHMAAALACALPLLVFELLRYPYRRKRLMSFLDPFAQAQGSGYQLVQSLTAVGSGGWFGKGLGASQLKLMYLPAAHTDFIFPILCEELGLLGSLAALALFTLFLLRGVRIARHAPNLFGTLLAAGITFLLFLQASFNVAMSIGLLPTKGLPLPFFSYGGSSLLATLASVGVLLNISRQSQTL